MITQSGFSKDPTIIPEGIVVTFGKDMIEAKGGLLSFLRYFEKHMAQANGLWLQKSKNQPQQDILYVYIIVCNRLAYRCFYGGYQQGLTRIENGNGHSFSYSSVIGWPRIILAGPFMKAPEKRTLKGFQGFRYCTKLF